MQNPEPTVDNVPPITSQAIKRAAAEELVSVATVLKELAGIRVRGLAGQRARRAVSRLRAGS